MNRRMRGPHVRWCGRGRVNPGPYPMKPNWREPRPPSVTGSAGATFPRREGESFCPPRGGPPERSEGEEGEA